ncbi:MAG: hypothetical protein JWN27_944 [Candidatus Eremiobacteraeota bacterium]|nr:hypothetical protein [Candidatus Eremiobacteraeota bacterium]
MIAALLAPAVPAHATTSTTSGNAQLRFTSGATLTMSIVTQYSAAGAQGNAVPTLLPSLAGVCTAIAAETNFSLSFGALAPRSNAATACLYKNAVAVAVNSNDANGFVVNEYLDTTPTSGIGICAFPNGGASFPLTPAVAPVPVSARSGNPVAGTFTGNSLTSCAAGGTIVPPGTGGVSSGGANPGNVGAPGLEFYSPSGTQLTFMTLGTPTAIAGPGVGNYYAAEDIQVNMAPGALSTTVGQTGVYMTIQLVPN